MRDLPEAMRLNRLHQRREHIPAIPRRLLQIPQPVTIMGLDLDHLEGEVWGVGKADALLRECVSVYVGDHVHDVEGALAAGALSVSVLTGGCTREELLATGTHVVLDDLTDFPDWWAGHVLETRLAAHVGRLEIATLDDLSKIGVLTPHLMANAAAAVAMARSYGIDPADVRAALLDFRLDAHRIELVAEQDGIRWIDDSKATNPHAAAASLNSFEKVIWVVGGLLKGVDLNDLVKKFADRLSAAIVIGVDRSHVIEVLSAQIPNLPVVEISSADNTDVMPQVVEAASEFTEAGSVVLLAPAAASMDQFKDYADRGNQFAEAVRAHLETA